MANPFLALKRIREIIDGEHESGTLPYGVEEVRAAVVAHSALDYIEFIEFQDPDNPIIGRYEKYSPITAYKPPSTYVEISYSSELNLCWRNFTVTKEMCHAFLDDDAMCVNDPAEVMVLINSLRSDIETKELLASVEPFKSEKLAEVLALELLCPVEERASISERRASGELDVSDMGLAIEYRIPVMYIPTIFSSDYIATIQRMLDES